MLTCDSIIDDSRHIVYAIDETNGNPIIRTTSGEFLNVPRFLVTTPTERCDECARPLEFRDVQRAVDKNKATCPDAEHHMYTMYWRQARDKKLNRQTRRKLRAKADEWLGKYLKIKRGRQRNSNACTADSTT